MGDLDRIIERREVADRPAEPPSGLAVIPWIDTMFAIDGALMPGGFPDEWLGQSVEVYGVPTPPAGGVSFALGWHGERPAVLWEQAGEPVELSAPVLAPEWASAHITGEALWPVPPGAGAAGSEPAGRDEPPSFN